MKRSYPPRPPSRSDTAGLWERTRAFGKDIFRSQPERLYRAKAARIKTPLYNSFLVNDPVVIDDILQIRADDFPKAKQLGRSLAPLLGRSVFTTNGEEWAQARSIIDPGFEQSRLRDAFPMMRAAGEAALARLSPGEVEIEFEASRAAADIIFRTLFSVSIDQARATRVFEAFRAYQRAQPFLSPLALLKTPIWVPGRGRGARHAARIRDELSTMIEKRIAAIAAGDAPNDLATHLLSAKSPQNGRSFTTDQALDQIAIFFLAGHETSASALAWALYCLAQNQDAQSEARAEIIARCGTAPIAFADLPKLRFTRDVFRETLRLYPPVPVYMRDAACPGHIRKMPVKKGDLCMVSPWYAQRNPDLWENPDAFDPWRWTQKPDGPYLPFSKGPRVCPGAGFAMIEGVMMLAMMLRKFRFETTTQTPVPVAHLTVRSEKGIFLNLEAAL